MNDYSNEIDQVERFLNQKMSDQEKKTLATRMDKETELSLFVQDMDTLVEGIKYSGSKTTVEEKLQKLRNLDPALLQALASETRGKGRILGIEPGLLWRMAAGFALIVAASVLFWKWDSAPVNEKLFTAYFEPFDSPGSGITRSSEQQITLKAEAYQAYDRKDFAKAERLFEQVLMTDDDAIMHLCLGNALLAQGKVDDAERIFLHLLKDHSDLVTQAKWYLALTYLKEEKITEAKTILNQISQSSTYGEKAKKLLNELD